MAQQVPVEEIRRPEPDLITKKKEENEKWDRPSEFPHIPS